MASSRGRTARRPDVTVVSPHFDDAPLSLGQSMLDGALAGCRVRVAVVFGRTNFTRWVHPTAGRARAVSLWRRGEEAAAQAVFGYRARAATWEEVVLRTGELDPAVLLDDAAELDTDLVDELTVWMRRLRGSGSTLLVPAGIGAHLDHRVVAEAARRLWAEHPDRLGFYEDRPYAALADRADVDAHMSGLVAGADGMGGLVPAEVSGPVTERLHRLLARCYPSQIDGLFIDAMERDRAVDAREQVWFSPGTVPAWAGGAAPRP